MLIPTSLLCSRLRPNTLNCRNSFSKVDTIGWTVTAAHDDFFSVSKALQPSDLPGDPAVGPGDSVDTSSRPNRRAAGQISVAGRCIQRALDGMGKSGERTLRKSAGERSALCRPGRDGT